MVRRGQALFEHCRRSTKKVSSSLLFIKKRLGYLKEAKALFYELSVHHQHPLQAIVCPPPELFLVTCTQSDKVTVLPSVV